MLKKYLLITALVLSMNYVNVMAIPQNSTPITNEYNCTSTEPIELSFDQFEDYIKGIQSSDVVEIKMTDVNNENIKQIAKILKEYSDVRVVLRLEESEMLTVLPAGADKWFMYDYAFNRVESIVGIYVSENVKEIELAGFCNCENLKIVSAPGVEKISKVCFANCKSLEKVEIPKVTDIPPSAFAKCEKLSNIQIGDVVTISESAFELCEALKSIQFPKVEIIESHTFDYCTFEEINFPNVKTVMSYGFCQVGMETVILHNATRIEDQGFSGCWKIKTIEVSSNCNISNIKNWGIPYEAKVYKYSTLTNEIIEIDWHN